MEKKTYTAAIDLGSNNVTVIVGSRDAEDKLHIDDIAIYPIKEGVVRGEIKNIEQVASSIRSAIEEVERRLGIRISEAITGISGQHIKCAKNSYYVYVGRDGEIREDDVQKLRDNMRNVQAPEGERILDFIPQYYVVNDEEEVSDPIGMFGQKLEATFNFIIGESVAISRIEKALEKVGIKQSQLFINPIVSAEAVVLPDEKELGVAVVDLGAGTSDICIYLDNVVRHVGVVPLGADMINKDIRAYGILDRHIEYLKTNYGSAFAENASAEKLIKVPGRTPRDPKEISFNTLSTIIEARLMDIFDYVIEEIKRAGFEDKLAAGIVITGGGANLKDIDLLIKSYTGYDVRIAPADIHVDDASLELVEDMGLSTAIGLLLKGTQSHAKPSKNTTERKISPVKPEAPATNKPTTQPTDNFSSGLDDSHTKNDNNAPDDKNGSKSKLRKGLDWVNSIFAKEFDTVEDTDIY